MADLQKNTRELAMGFEKVDGKTRYITLPNPDYDLSADSVRSAMQYILDNNVLLDNENQSYTGIVTAYTETKTKTTLDLE